MDEQLSAADKKTSKTVQSIQKIQAALTELYAEQAKAGAVKVTPVAGGAMSPLSELGRGFTETGGKQIATRARKKMQRELAALTAVINGETVNVAQEIEKRTAAMAQLGRRALEGVAESEVAALQSELDALGIGITASADGLRAVLDRSNSTLDF